MFIIFRFQIIHEKKNLNFIELKELVKYLIKLPNEDNFFHFSNLENLNGDKLIEAAKKINDNILYTDLRYHYWYFDWIKIDLFSGLVTCLDSINKEVRFYKIEILFPILICVSALIFSIILLPFNEIIISEKNTLSLPIYTISMVVALAVAGILSVVIAFVKMIIEKSY